MLLHSPKSSRSQHFPKKIQSSSIILSLTATHGHNVPPVHRASFTGLSTHPVIQQQVRSGGLQSNECVLSVENRLSIKSRPIGSHSTAYVIENGRRDACVCVHIKRERLFLFNIFKEFFIAYDLLNIDMTLQSRVCN